MFDFIFYRLYVFYEKKEKNGDSVWTAAFYVTLLQFLMLYSVVIFIDIFSNKALLTSVFHDNKMLATVISIVILISLFLFNRYRYRHKLETIISKYSKCPGNKWFKIWMIAVIMMVLLLSPILWNEIHKLIVG